VCGAAAVVKSSLSLSQDNSAQLELSCCLRRASGLRGRVVVAEELQCFLEIRSATTNARHVAGVSHARASSLGLHRNAKQLTPHPP
jgi:hypothetical protein